MAGQHAHGVPWEKLDVTYATKDIPPGWYLGCSLTLEKYETRCDDWKLITGYDTEQAMVAALRQRTQGPVRTYLDANKTIPMKDKATVRFDEYGQTVKDEAGVVIVDLEKVPKHTPWEWHFKMLKENYGEQVQAIVEKYIEEFLQYHRKRGQKLQEYVSEYNLKYQKAAEQGLLFGPILCGYWFLRQGRLTEDQKRWILMPLDNDWTKLKEMQQQCIKIPDSMNGAAHWIDIQTVDDEQAYWAASPYGEENQKNLYQAYGETSDWGEGSEWEHAYWEVFECLQQALGGDPNDPNTYEEFDAYMNDAEEAIAYYEAEEGDDECYWDAPEEAYWGDEAWDSSDPYGGDYDEDDATYYGGANGDDGEDIDITEIYAIGAMECDTDDDAKECDVYMQHRKSIRAIGKGRTGKGTKRRFGGRPVFKRIKGSKFGKGGGGYRRRKPWRRPKGKGGKSGKPRFGKRRFGRSFGQRRRSRTFTAMPVHLKHTKGRGKGKKGFGKKGKGPFGADDDGDTSYAPPFGKGPFGKGGKGFGKGKR